MESFVLLSAYLKRDIIQESFTNMKPFLNINEQDGIYYYRILIILKMLFTFRTLKSTIPNYVAHVVFAVSNAYIANKYNELAILPALAQCLLCFAPSKKFALFTSITWMYILSMNIKPYEFILDLCVVLLMLRYAYEAYSNEIQKFCTVISIGLTLGWCVCDLEVFSLFKFFSVIIFLFLAYAPLKPNWHNKHRDRLVFFYAFMFIFIVYKFQLANYSKTQTFSFKTENISELSRKWGHYAPVKYASSVNLENVHKMSLTKNMSDAFTAKLVEESLMNNLTSMDELLTNACRAEDSNDKMYPVNSFTLNENIKSSVIDEGNLTEKSLLKNLDCQKLLHKCEPKDSQNKMHLVEGITPVENTNVNLKHPLKALENLKEDSLMKNLTCMKEEREREKEECQTDEDLKSVETDKGNFPEEKLNEDIIQDIRMSEEFKSIETDNTNVLKGKAEDNEEVMEDEYKLGEVKLTTDGNDFIVNSERKDNEEKGMIQGITKSNYEFEVTESSEEANKVETNMEEQLVKDFTLSHKSKSIEIAGEEEKVNEKEMLDGSALCAKTRLTEDKEMDVMEVLQFTDDGEIKLIEERIQDMPRPDHESPKLMDFISKIDEIEENETVEEGIIEELSTPGEEYKSSENNEMGVTEIIVESGREEKRVEMMQNDESKPVKSVEETDPVIKEKNEQEMKMEKFSILNKESKSRTEEMNLMVEGKQVTDENILKSTSKMMGNLRETVSEARKKNENDITKIVSKQKKEVEQLDEFDSTDETAEGQMSRGKDIIQDVPMQDEEFKLTESGEKHLEIKGNRIEEQTHDSSNVRKCKSMETIKEINLTAESEKPTEDELMQDVSNMQEEFESMESEWENDAKEESMQDGFNVIEITKSMETVERNAVEELIQNESSMPEESKSMETVGRNVQEESMQDESDMQEESRSMEVVEWEENVEQEAMQIVSNKQEEWKLMEIVEWEKNVEEQRMEDVSNMQKEPKLFSSEGARLMDEEANKMDAIEYIEKNYHTDINSIAGDMYVISENEGMYVDDIEEEYMTDDLKMTESDGGITVENDGNKGMYFIIRNRKGKYYIL